MTAKMLFGVLLRIFGVGLILLGIHSAFTLALLWFQSENAPHREAFDFNTGGWAWSALWLSAAGLYLLRGAPHIIRFAYPRDPDEAPTRRAKQISQLDSVVEQLYDMKA